MPLTDLPTEILAQIGRYLDTPSLCAFSLANSLCRVSAAQWIFRSITIRRAKDAMALRITLDRSSCAKYVRCLKVDDLGRPEHDAFREPLSHKDYQTDRESSQAVYKQYLSWRSLATLIRTLPRLSDLIWVCGHQLPSCILRACEHLASCKLHIRSFEIRSLREEFLDPYELAIVRSPSLHSIWVIHDPHGLWHDGHYVLDVVSRMMSGWTPNLRCVRMWQGVKGLNRIAAAAPPPLTSLLDDAMPTKPNRKAGLREIELFGGGHLLREQLEEWSRCADFGMLESFISHRFSTPETIDFLADCAFLRLQTLSIRMLQNTGMLDDVADFSLPGGRLLCNLPPLLALGLTGQLDRPNLYKSISHHGISLTKLMLCPAGESEHRLALSLADVVWIQRHCKMLEDFTLTMPRSGGDATEVAIYRMLGRFPRLQNLDLALDSSNRETLKPPEGYHNGVSYETPYEAWFDEFDMEYVDGWIWMIKPRQGHLRQMMINCALDQNLARSIYLTIARSKPERSIPLARVHLRSEGGGEFGCSDWLMEETDIYYEFQRHWIIERRSGSMKVEDVNIKEMDETVPRDQELSPRFEAIFRRIWPAKSESGNWRSDWYSFPLHGSAGVSM